jgi:hypothetical protein
MPEKHVNDLKSENQTSASLSATAGGRRNHQRVYCADARRTPTRVPDRFFGHTQNPQQHSRLNLFGGQVGPLSAGWKTSSPTTFFAMNKSLKDTKPHRIRLTPTHLYHVERCTVCGNDKHVSRNAPRDFGYGPSGFVCIYCEVKQP